MKKRNQKFILLPIVALLGGCFDSASDVVQRDVYQTKEDCIKDWGEEQLCEIEMSDEKKSEVLSMINNTSNKDIVESSNNSIGNTGQSQTVASNNQVVSSSNSSSSSSGFLNGYIVGMLMNGGSSSSSAASNLNTTRSNYVGPTYYEGNRAVQTNSGKIIQPKTNYSTGTPMVVKALRDGGVTSTPYSNSYSKPVSKSSSSHSSGSISRGGFGGHSGGSSGG